MNVFNLHVSLHQLGWLDRNQKVCLNMVKKDQLCAIALTKKK